MSDDANVSRRELKLELAQYETNIKFWVMTGAATQIITLSLAAIAAAYSLGVQAAKVDSVNQKLGEVATNLKAVKKDLDDEKNRISQLDSARRTRSDDSGRDRFR